MIPMCWCGGEVQDGKCLSSVFHDPVRMAPPVEPKVLYISGPMSNYPDANYPAFYRAADVLRAAGYEVRNPADVGSPDSQYEDLIRKDLALLLEAGGVAVLEGWWASRGAGLETAVANALKMPIRTVSDWVQRAQVDGALHL